MLQPVACDRFIEFFFAVFELGQRLDQPHIHFNPSHVSYHVGNEYLLLLVNIYFFIIIINVRPMPILRNFWNKPDNSEFLLYSDTGEHQYEYRVPTGEAPGGECDVLKVVAHNSSSREQLEPVKPQGPDLNTYGSIGLNTILCKGK
jgi:hypothetical protein